MQVITHDILSRLSIFSLQSRKEQLIVVLKALCQKPGTWDRFLSFQNARTYQISKNSQAVVISVVAVCQVILPTLVV